MKESLEEVQEKYKLSEEESKQIQEDIIKKMLFKKTPVKNPKAIFDIAPPGSGKTGLNGYAVKQFSNDNIIVVNNDELKPFHPKADEISKLYPEYYIKVTNEESKIWTDGLMDVAIEGGYNVIYEGTGRKLKILEKMMSKMNNYQIIVRAMAVNELNCLMSIVERYEGQVKEKGWGRIVSTSTFYKAYDSEMLDTIDIFEKEKMVDIVEVYIRGKLPTNPIRIYNSNIKEFSNAREAIIDGRKKDREQANEYFRRNFSKGIFENKNVEEEKEMLEKINNLCSIKKKYELER